MIFVWLGCLSDVVRLKFRNLLVGFLGGEGVMMFFGWSEFILLGLGSIFFVGFG